MVSIAGHHVDLHTRAEDVGGLSKIGLSICFASLLAALQFGIAGWFLAVSLDPFEHAVVSVTIAFIGALVVLLIDRSFIYASDTRVASASKLGYFYIALRIFLILAIGSLSSQFVLPLLLKSELAIHIHDLKDRRYDEASFRYREKYSVQEKITNEQDIRSSISKIRAELQNPPQSLVRQKLEAESCLSDYKRKLNSAIGPDVDPNEVTNLFVTDKAACDRLNVVYKEAYQGYVNPRKAALVQHQDAYNQAHEEANTAQALMKSDLQHADENNRQFLNVSSADVLWDLIKTNPGARTKYLLVTIVQLVLELMPLLLKSLMGRSPLGIAIAMQMGEKEESFDEDLYQRQLRNIERLEHLTQVKNKQRMAALDEEISIQEQQNYLDSLKPASALSSLFSTKPFNKGSKFAGPEVTESTCQEKRATEQRNSFFDSRWFATT